MTNKQPLSADQLAQVRTVFDQGQSFIALLHLIGGTLDDYETTPAETRQASRELSLAQSRIEEAVMWATKHVNSRRV